VAAFVGTVSLAIALSLAAYGGVASVVGARRRNASLVESARTTAYSVFALVAVANGAMFGALLSNDFSVRYVATNSSVSTPTFFKVLALWSADEGSLLLWNLVLAGFVAMVAFRFRARRPETFPWAIAAMYCVVAFYLLLVLGPTTPFETLASTLADGRGPLPLLQNAARGNGAINAVPDRDAVVRRVPMILQAGGELYPSLLAEALRVVRRHRGGSSY